MNYTEVYFPIRSMVDAGKKAEPLYALKNMQGSSRVRTRPAGWVREVFKFSRVGSGRVGRFSNSHGSLRATLTRPDPT